MGSRLRLVLLPMRCYNAQILDKVNFVTTFAYAGDIVPQGLVSNNWGGSPIEHWSSPDALAKCITLK